jgi:hypothetical protein
MKIHPVGAKYFQVVDAQTDMMMLIVTFHNFSYTLISTVYFVCLYQ